MIQANELRIGNYVYPNDENATPYSVLAIGKDSFVCCWKNNIGEIEYVSYNEAQPIPLTPKILENCGFEKASESEDIYRLIFNEFEYLYIGKLAKNLKFVLFEIHSMDNEGEYTQVYFLRKDIEYLHELQNLYFALTGTELEINLLSNE